MFTNYSRKRSVSPSTSRRSFRPTFEALEDRCVPAVLTVNTIADETNDTDVLSLREAILLVNNGGDANLALGRDLSANEQLQVQGAFADNDTIQFAAALSQQTIALANMALPNLLEDVVIAGPTGGITLDAGQQSRILFVNSGVMAQLSGLTLTRGDEVTGGGVYNSGSLTLTGCTLTGNTASYGGALYSDGVAVTMTDCTVSSNSASVSTGGLYNVAGTMSLTNCTLSHNENSAVRNESNLSLTKCTLSDNTSSTGGGVYHARGTVTLTACTFARNAATSYGGGIYISNDTAIVTGCTFTLNSASTGGGIYNNNRLILTNSTVSGNSCSSSGGGIYNGFRCTLTAVNSTIVLNRAGNAGGGIYDKRVTSDTLNNCIVAGNTSAGLPDDVRSITVPDGQLATGSNTLIGNADSASGLSDGTNGNIVGLNGQGTRAIDSILNVVLADRGGPTKTHGLLVGSAALNAGANALAVDANAQPLAFDQRGTGFPRIAGSNVDMGAFEGTVPPPVHPTAVVNTLADTIDASDGKLSLREALAVFSGTLDVSALSQGEQQQISGDVPFDGVITFDAALAGGTIAMTLGEFALDQQVTITGPAQGITLDAQMQSRVMRVGSGVVAQLSNLNFTHGTHDSGGGIFNEGSLALTNGSLSANAAEYGGAIYSTGDVLLSGCTLTGNTAATSGGGLFNEGPTTLTNCTFSGNMAESAGGAIYHDGRPAPLVMTGCTLTGNTAHDSAGGLYVFAGSSTLTDCTFSNNSGPEGGAIVMGGTMRMTGCSLVGNTASDSAGGIYNSAGDLTLTNCTLSDNSAPKAGAILNSQTISNMAPFRSITKLVNCTVVRNQSLNGGGILNQSTMIPVLNNTIVAGNTNGSGVPNDIGGTVLGSNNLIGDPNSAGGLDHGVNGNIVGDGMGQAIALDSIVDPVLAFNGGLTQTHALVANSPALNVGDNALAVDTSNTPLANDQRGASFVRVFGSSVDIGAFEAQSLSGPIVVDTLEDNTDPADGKTSLREAIQLANVSLGTDAIQFAAALAGQTITLNGSVLPKLADGVTITGPGGGITLDAHEQSNMLIVEAGVTASISGLTFVNGNEEGGGAILNQGDLTLSGCTFSNNHADSGGGIYNAPHATLTLTDCTFSANTSSTSGGGIFNDRNATLMLTGCTLNANTASGNSGGGIANYGTLTLTNSTLSGNAAAGDGGGIYNQGTQTVVNCTIVLNSAGNGNGGGIANVGSGSTTTVNNSLVAGNTQNGTTPSDLLRRSGTVVGSHNLIGDPNSAGGLIHGTSGNILGNGSGSLVPAASLIDLVLADNGGPTLTHALAGGSPALDAGDDALAALLTTDQRGAGFPRVRGVHVDIGAVEADTFFTDTFTGPDEDTLGDEYTQVGGQFRVVNGEAVATGQKPAQAVITQVSSADVAVEADVDLAGKRSRVGLVVRYTPAQGKQQESYYFARLVNRDGRVFAEIRRYHKGEVKVLASRGTNLGGDEHMRFEAVGTALKLFVNGELVVYAQDSALSGPGQVGIRARYGTKIDNLQVFLLNSSPVTLPFADDFSLGSNGNTQLSLSWREQEGNYQIQTTGQNSFALGDADQSTATLNGLSADSLGVQADVELNGTRSNVGFVTHFVRGSKGDSYYWAGLNVDAEGVNTATVVKVVNGKVKSLPNGKVVLPDTFSRGVPHELRFIASEGTLQLEIDDVVTVTTTDANPLAAGSAGLRSSSGTRYDNVQVFQTR